MINTLDSIGVTIEVYGQYKGEGYGAHALKVTDLWGNEFWFSYTTLVAFKINGEFHIIENYWGMTTGRHLNWINGNKDIREDETAFVRNYQRLVYEFTKIKENTK